MAERPRIVDFGLLEPLSVRDRLRGERMCAAAGKPLPSCTPTNVLRPWRQRPKRRSVPLPLRNEPPLTRDRKGESPRREFRSRAISEMMPLTSAKAEVVLGVHREESMAESVYKVIEIIGTSPEVLGRSWQSCCRTCF